MQLADRSTTAYITATDSASPKVTEVNQKAYQRLKLALSLGLRRQIFLAVCDDLALRNRIAARLYAELAYPSQKTAPQPTSLPVGQPSERWSISSENNQLLVDAEACVPVTYPCLVSLNLNMSDPNPMLQVAEWLAQYPPPQRINQPIQSPGFQILGTERLTRQPAPIQKRFLSSLQQVEHYLSCLESALLLWLPRPWLHAVQQSAPDFWNWHTALFEFEGDPTPVTAINSSETGRTNRLARSSLKQYEKRGVVGIGASDAANAASGLANSEPAHAAEPAIATESSIETSLTSAQLASQLTSSLASQSETQQENFWQILTEDLAQLGQQTSDDSNRNPSLDKTQSDSPLPSAAQPTFAQPPEDSTANEPVANHPPAEAATTLMSAASSEDSAEPQTLSATTPTPTTATEPPAESSTTLSPLSETRFALDLSDLVLAAAAQEVGGTTPSKHSQPIQALQHIEHLHHKQAPRAALAAAYQNFGALYRDRIEQGDISEQTLVIAIRAYEHALEWLEESSSLWSDILNDIGNLYWMRSRSAPDASQTITYLEQAISTYQQALAKTNPATRPHSYAMIQNNLGSAYGDFARYQDSFNMLLKAVRAYEAALSYRKFEDDPARYAATQNNLGTTYWNLAQHQEPIRWLKQAVASYNEALRYYSPSQEPMNYAMLQNNLGTAYWNLAQQEQSAKDTTGRQNTAALKLLLQAIAAYHAALVHRTLELAPTAHAATQNNLGTAHWHIANLSNIHPDKRREQLQQAIVAYKSAVAAIQYLATAETGHMPALTFDQFATHNNLGLAYYQLATDKQKPVDEITRSNLLEAALSHHSLALQGWQSQPELYQSALSYVIQTVRTFHEELGVKGQSLALSRIPASILPEVMKRL